MILRSSGVKLQYTDEQVNRSYHFAHRSFQAVTATRDLRHVGSRSAYSRTARATRPLKLP